MISVRVFKSLVIGISLFFMLTSCSHFQNLASQNQTPVGCENSVIYKNIPNPKLIGVVNIIVVNEGVIAYPKAKPFIKTGVESLLKALEDDSLTYVDFLTMVSDNVKWVNKYFGNRLVTYTEILSIFDSPLPIDSCDRDLIKAHLLKIKNLVN